MKNTTLLCPEKGEFANAPLWRDRHEAGLQLAEFMASRSGPWQRDGSRDRMVRYPIVLALPRGGVTVAQPIAQRLECELATWSVRKVTMEEDSEYALGAVAAGPTIVWTHADPLLARLTAAERHRLVSLQLGELERRQRCYGDPSAEVLQHHPVIVVDDGAATGLTAQAALDSLRRLDVHPLVLTVPVIDREVALRLRNHCDMVVAFAVVDDLVAVGRWYVYFEQLTDDEVLRCLGQAAGSRSKQSWECSDAV